MDENNIANPFTVDTLVDPTSSWASSTTSWTISSSATGANVMHNGNIYTTAGMNGTSWNNSIKNPTLEVNGDAKFEGDIQWKGRSLVKLLESIEDRLAILQEPDPKKLEKFAALKKAYDHYKLMEKLIGED
jgi:hypothetical protein